jgi:hypothetical protein
MSRSFRKPYCVDGYKGSTRKQFEKRLANRTIRNSEDVPNGKAYKKFFDSWNITDYRWYQTPSQIEKYWPEWWKLLRK